MDNIDTLVPLAPTLGKGCYSYAQPKIVGNLIPHSWHKRFTDKRDNPDLVLISILSEIVYWHRPRKVKDKSTGQTLYTSKFEGDAWQTSYSHFAQKLNFSHEKIRRKLVRLEELGIITREYRTVEVRGQKYSNRLFISINPKFLEPFIPSSDMSPVTGNSMTNMKNDEGCFVEGKGRVESDRFSKVGSLENIPSIDDINNEFNCETKANVYSSSSPNRSNAFATLKFEDPYPQIGGEHIIDNKNKEKEYKNRLSTSKDKSNFESNFFEFNFNGENKNQQKRQIPFDTPKTLGSFYPLSEEDRNILQKTSGREFSLKAMNEILQDMGSKLQSRAFNSKQAFLSYMSKAFKYEKRDAVKISNEGFTIARNRNSSLEKSLRHSASEQIKQARREEEEKAKAKYLQEVEEGRSVTKEDQLRRKIAGTFEQGQAYEILTSCKITLSDKGPFISLSLIKKIELTEKTKEKILEQARGVYGQHIEYIEIKNDRIYRSGYSTYGIKEDHETVSYTASSLCSNKRPEAREEWLQELPQGSVEEPVKKCGNSVWQKVRANLRNYYGEEIDKAWFSKLEAEEEESSKAIKLKSPTSFFSSYIEQNYGITLRKAFESENYKFMGLAN